MAELMTYALCSINHTPTCLSDLVTLGMLACGSYCSPQLASEIKTGDISHSNTHLPCHQRLHLTVPDGRVSETGTLLTFQEEVITFSCGRERKGVLHLRRGMPSYVCVLTCVCTTVRGADKHTLQRYEPSSQGQAGAEPTDLT